MDKISVSSGMDWVSCTMASKHLKLVKERVKALKLGDFEDTDKINALHGYKTAYKLNGGRLQWGFSNDDSFVHFELSGQGCVLLGGEIWGLLMFLKSLNAKFTRIDLAFDFTGTDRLFSALARDLNNKRFTGFQSWQEISSTDRGVKATTFYLGSRSSTRFARVYDKGLESGLSDVPGEIVRFEFVFRSEQCQVVARLLLDEGQAVAGLAGLTFNLYRFGTYQKRHRDEVFKNSAWYQALIDSFSGMKLRDMPSTPHNIAFEKYCRWLVEQVVPQLRIIAVDNQISVGKVLDTIHYFHQEYSTALPVGKDKYSHAFKKMLREKDEVLL